MLVWQLDTMWSPDRATGHVLLEYKLCIPLTITAHSWSHSPPTRGDGNLCPPLAWGRIRPINGGQEMPEPDHTLGLSLKAWGDMFHSQNHTLYFCWIMQDIYVTVNWFWIIGLLAFGYFVCVLFVKFCMFLERRNRLVFAVFVGSRS